MKKMVIGVVILGILAGCRSTEELRRQENMIEQLQEQKTELQQQLEKVTTERNQLESQIEVLTSLDSKVKAKDIYDMQSLRIGNYTGFYDKDDDGTTETLIVYLQPIGLNGDVVRAIGDIEVQVWNLNAPAGGGMIKRWSVEPAELKDNWYCSLITNYRLTFEAGDIAANAEGDLTVRIIFTDHLSGKVFKEQTVISAH